MSEKMREKRNESVMCKFGVVKEVWLSEKKVVVIHSPVFWESGYRRQLELVSEGYDAVRLNTGVEEEAIEADRLLELCFDSAREN